MRHLWSICFGLVLEILVYIHDALALALGEFAIGDDLAILEETCYMLEIFSMRP